MFETKCVGDYFYTEYFYDTIIAFYEYEVGYLWVVLKTTMGVYKFYYKMYLKENLFIR